VSIPRPSNIHPDEWVEDKLSTGKQRASEFRDELESMIEQHPLRSVAIGAAAGYLARSLPVARVLGASVRLTLPLVPYALLAIGAARAWEFFQTDADRVRPNLLRKRSSIPMSPTERCIESCNKLLRGELSAIETYGQAVRKFNNEVEEKALEHLLATHEDSASRLRQHIAEMGGTASFDSGLWGDFATAVEGAAVALGESPALTVLKAGEEHGIREYDEALCDPNVMEEMKSVIRQHLLPRAHENVNVLLRLKHK